jgi:hypothetical protein
LLLPCPHFLLNNAPPGYGLFTIMDWDNLVLNCSAFIAGLFLLRSGADLFISHVEIIARRYNVPETLITLLTAGSWEEVIVQAHQNNSH